MLAEDRANGTVLTHNSTNLGTLAGHYTRQWTDDTISLLGYHTRQEYHASFSAVAADRNTERITFLQTVPATAGGGAGMWRHHSRSWNLLAGADAQRVEGTSIDSLVRPGSASEADPRRSKAHLLSWTRVARRRRYSLAPDISLREPTGSSSVRAEASLSDDVCCGRAAPCIAHFERPHSMNFFVISGPAIRRPDRIPRCFRKHYSGLRSASMLSPRMRDSVSVCIGISWTT